MVSAICHPSIAVVAALALLCVVVDMLPNRHLSRASRRQQQQQALSSAGLNLVVNNRAVPTNYSCLDPNGPRPYILMTMGRSGSSSTFQIIGNLTGLETPAEEVPGPNDRKIRNFLRRHEGDGGRWVLDKLCKKQRAYPDAAVVGFKWKSQPAEVTHLPGFVEAMVTVAGATDPPIAVVRSRRNLLDVVLSRAKHSSELREQEGEGTSKTGKKKKMKVPPHCLEGQEWCLRKHREAGTGMTLRTDGLLEFLTNLTRGEDEVDDLLQDMGVRHVSVSYERLYGHDEDAQEWARIFRLLGVGPTMSEGLTRGGIEAAMWHVGTSNPYHKETLANYADVKGLLEGTQHEQLLHRL